MSNIFDKIHKPKNCLLLIALPVTEGDFYKDLEDESLKDYAKLRARLMKFRPESLWKIDHLPLVNLLKNTALVVEKAGVTVKWNVCLKDLKDLSNFDVVTLVAHFNNEKKQVELYDKLHSVDDIVANFDETFTGFLDLSVCNSTVLQDKMKEKYEHQFFIKANKGLAELKIHLKIYKAIIQLLSRKDNNYLTTSMRLMSDLNDYVSKKQ